MYVSPPVYERVCEWVNVCRVSGVSGLLKDSNLILNSLISRNMTVRQPILGQLRFHGLSNLI